MSASKIIIGTLLAGVAISVIGAKVISSQVEEGVRTTIEAYAQQSQLPLEVVDFEAGWFSSSFNIRMAISEDVFPSLAKLGKNTLDETSILFSSEVTHGPIIFQDGIHFGAAYATGDVHVNMQELLGNEETSEEGDRLLIQLSDHLSSKYTVLASLGGDIEYTSVLEGGTGSGTIMDGDDSAKISWTINPVEASWILNSDADTSNISFQWGGGFLNILSSDAGKIQLDFETVSGTGVSKRLGKEFWANDFDIQLGKMLVDFKVDSKDMYLELGNSTYTATTNLQADKKDRVDASFVYDMDNLIIKNGKGEMSLGNTTMNFEAHDILLEVLDVQAKYGQKAWQELAQTKRSSVSASTDKMVKELRTVVTKQLQSGLQLNLTELTTSNEAGSFSLSSDFSLPGTLNINAFDETEKLYAGILGTSTLKVDQPFLVELLTSGSQMQGQSVTAEQVSQLLSAHLGQYVSMGLIMQEGTQLQSTAVIKDDVIIVNGLPLAKLSQMAGQAR